jgi:hypothetical protein
MVKDLERDGPAPIQVLSLHFLECLKKNKNLSIIIVLAEIRTHYLPSVSPGDYRYCNLVAFTLD